MNPALAAVLANNKADIQAVIDKVGLGTIIELAPHFAGIAASANHPQPLVAVLTGNGPDIKAIVEKIGLDNIVALFPHFAACAATYLAAPKQ
jgi:hypothetical protein